VIQLDRLFTTEDDVSYAQFTILGESVSELSADEEAVVAFCSERKVYTILTSIVTEVTDNATT